MVQDETAIQYKPLCIQAGSGYQNQELLIGSPVRYYRVNLSPFYFLGKGCCHPSVLSFPSSHQNVCFVGHGQGLTVKMPMN